jgi:hypothetical protein
VFHSKACFTIFPNKKPILLCGDGFIDFIHRPKSKILKTLKNENHSVSEAGSASALRRMEGEKRKTPTLLGPLDRASYYAPSSNLFRI